jgi:hypothetical protein
LQHLADSSVLNVLLLSKIRVSVFVIQGCGYEQDIQNTVKARPVFYILGYNPIHPRRYRELYRTDGVAQAAISNYQLTLSPKQGGGNYGWQVDSVSLMVVRSMSMLRCWFGLTSCMIAWPIRLLRPTGNLFAQHGFTSRQVHCGG